MTDIFDKKKRSEIMQSVHSANNKSTEQALIKLFRKYKITGWRRQWNIVGHPDFVFLKYRIAIFVDGCFWHGCKKCNRMPKSKISFWHNKIEKNKSRDKKCASLLSKLGWHVVRIWEHELKGNVLPNKIIRLSLVHKRSSP
jgi:DNA mismatch endonuclease, patch repair protein